MKPQPWILQTCAICTALVIVTSIVLGNVDLMRFMVIPVLVALSYILLYSATQSPEYWEHKNYMRYLHREN